MLDILRQIHLLMLLFQDLVLNLKQVSKNGELIYSKDIMIHLLEMMDLSLMSLISIKDYSIHTYMHQGSSERRCMAL